ncbi:nicotinate-nucleotide--dimethylbenzimidazole phosphoribosyltransferase [Sneathiella litorea]|uniref:Nicotinate-nucleotide--dimethylbenzimidazole phosphoribosyltransferase n=1 Tax=Sneathiella litorea TaxID=2606216 RepID=A0A6L8W2I8_9PROT|nr:nicotinate-nucleotide--dimethylbenzimidazole phosphoribosyltransferase [Sneathiella litorea]MZR29138.1 nicotinate-nucleotide--dimethylbenzimidazole phosphoribosyltransferase [Sneathiella litorea]
MMAGPLSDFRKAISKLSRIDKNSADAARARDAVLTKPAGALGQLETLAIWLSGWQGKHPPSYDHPQVVIFAANHGVCDQGISAFPQEVTLQMVGNFESGGAAINQLALAFGASFSVTSLELDNPTKDFTKAPAMDETECANALSTGWNAVDENTDILVVGEMGIGNTTVAAALSAAIFGGRGTDWAGPGTGVSSEGIQHKAKVIDDGLLRHKDILDDPLKILQCLGGREIAAMVGSILAARQKHIPVLLDGFVATAAAAVLYKANPESLDHCIAAHVSAEPGHGKLLKAIDKEPLLSLSMRLGEGSGAALALGIIKGAVATHNGMASFADAGISGEKAD